MTYPLPRNWQLAVLLLTLAGTLAACGTDPAPNFRGRWRTVNHYTVQPEEIPLHTAYVFAPSPLDHTLKAMLTRWARDSKMTLSYLAPSDYTLHQPVAHISTSSIQHAVGELSQAYAAQGVSVTYANNQIVVRGGTVSAAAPANSR
ncbi:MAG: hypothetical protein DI635_07875 [Pseudoxanthomonas suwonensis]|nr:MAG: hypothetical protein DI635_07875 [Pseudoxanthomonas suwonensis]